jgi:uncharacterized membrane protein
LSSLILIFLISLVPAVELRGSIPLALALSDIHPLFVFLICVALNLLVIPLTFKVLDLFAPPLIRRSRWIASIFAWFLRRGHGRKWGLVGLAAFVGIPLPVTGAYTGTLMAYLLGMKRGRAALAIAVGVVIAGLIVTLATLGIISFFGIERAPMST